MSKKKLQKTRPAFENDMSIVPCDILVGILSKLPAKSLIRFKSVSKPWNVTISDNDFKKTQHHHSKALGCEKLLVRQTTSNCFEFRDLKSSQRVMLEKQIFLPEKFQHAQVLCSCDGLLLLKNPRAYKTYVLWNPSTREYRTIACPYFNYKGKVPNACGLCYDSSVDDYNVILIHKSCYALYSLNNDCWTKKTSLLPQLQQVLRNCSLSQGISTGDFVFWSNDNIVHRTSTIIYFDVKSVELKALPTPGFVGENHLFGLSSWKGCLSLYGGHAQSLVLDIWIMEQDSWIRYTCNLTIICKRIVEEFLLCFPINGEVLFQVQDCSICLDSLYFSSLECHQVQEEERPAFEDDQSIVPYEILFCILIWLPVKSLLRFQSVSKPWNAIISDKDFKKSHLDQSKALGCEKLLLNQVFRGVFEIRDLEGSRLVMTKKQRFPLKSFQYPSFLCSCDGLVLLKNRLGYKTYVLWNPSTGDNQTFSCPDNHLYYNDEARNVSAYGLCYDSSACDYKVILIYDLFYAIYSLNNDSWTQKTSYPCPVRPVYHNEGSSGITTEGCVFWSLNKRFPLVHIASTIIYFDVKSDEVKQLPTPDFVGKNDLFRLTSLKGCLSLYGGTIQSEQLHVWVMEQDGWKWLMNICNLPTICKKFVEDKRLLLCFTRNGEVLFQDRHRLKLFIYNPKKQKLREAQISKVSKVSKHALICLDSLYFSSLNVKCKRKQSTIPLTARR